MGVVGLRLVLSERLSLGLGAVSLRALGAGPQLWMDLDSGDGVGPGLGRLADWRRVHRLGAPSAHRLVRGGATLATLLVLRPHRAFRRKLLGSSATGVISGTPTVVTATASYTVTATNSVGSTTASVSITINEAAPK